MEENEWLDIEPMLWVKICKYLNYEDIVSLSGTCSFLKYILQKRRKEEIPRPFAFWYSQNYSFYLPIISISFSNISIKYDSKGLEDLIIQPE